MSKKSSEAVNLLEYPNKISDEYRKGEVCVLGDLHACPIKLFFFMVKTGAIRIKGDTLIEICINYRFLCSPYTKCVCQSILSGIYRF